MRTPQDVRVFKFVGSRVNLPSDTVKEWLADTRVADRQHINSLVCYHYPHIYKLLDLQARNPFSYLKTEKHLIVVHETIEYFFEYEV